MLKTSFCFFTTDFHQLTIFLSFYRFRDGSQKTFLTAPQEKCAGSAGAPFAYT
jgi:hypothetical protein